MVRCNLVTIRTGGQSIQPGAILDARSLTPIAAVCGHRRILEDDVAALVQEGFEGVFLVAVATATIASYSVPFHHEPAVGCRPAATIADITVYLLYWCPMRRDHLIRLLWTWDFGLAVPQVITIERQEAVA